MFYCFLVAPYIYIIYGDVVFPIYCCGDYLVSFSVDFLKN